MSDGPHLIQARIRRAGGESRNPYTQRVAEDRRRAEELVAITETTVVSEIRAGATHVPAVLVAEAGCRASQDRRALTGVVVSARQNTVTARPGGSWDVLVITYGPRRRPRLLGGDAHILALDEDGRGSGGCILAVRPGAVYAFDGEVRRHLAVNGTGARYEAAPSVDAARALGWLPLAEGEAEVVLE